MNCDTEHFLKHGKKGRRNVTIWRRFCSVFCCKHSNSEMESSKRLFTIVVEGNIGSGKSTFLSQFSDLSNVDVLTEPIDKWCNVDGRHNLLQLMYEDPTRHSLTFQSYVQLTMTQLHVKKPSSERVNMKVMERSLFSARHCFVENLWRSGKLADSEYGVLCEWFKFLTSSPKIDLGIDLIVYLRTKPEVAWERVKSRARSEEKIIPLEYLQEVHALHEEWLMTPNSKAPAKILVVDVNQDVSTCPGLYQKIVDRVLSAIDEKNQRHQQSPLVVMSPIKNCLSPVKAVVVPAAF